MTGGTDMVLIVCIDDKNGMMFNKRRQSKDSAVRADMLAEAGGSAVWMNSYSAKQFEEPAANIAVDEAFLDKAGQGEFCFLEGAGAASAEASAEKLIIYKWNRAYPSDVKFDIDLSGWKLERTVDFAGTSHEKITKEVYIK